MLKKSVTTETLKATAVKAIGLVQLAPKSPDDSMDELFSEVQSQQLYDGSKFFVDLVPKKNAALILKAYRSERRKKDFDLDNFVESNFYRLEKPKSDFPARPGDDAIRHIMQLWSDSAVTNRRDRGSLLALPYKYIVPGGMFQEQFYWDSYFIMLGLATGDRWSSIEGMMKNYAYMIRKFGFIPTANRSYFLTRSQPPFFSHMVELLAEHNGETVFTEYLPYMIKEYNFWMKGHRRLSFANHTSKRVVLMPDHQFLNRYYDNKAAPRPESYDKDIATVSANRDNHNDIYLHLRAAAESGWDFSSRWFDDPDDIKTIRTTDIIPVDLNCLLYHLESTIARTYESIKQKRLAKTYKTLSDKRAAAIQSYCWDESKQFFYDYDFVNNRRTGRETLAALFPLYVGIASPEQAKAVAEKIEKEFLKDGGLLTTLINSGEQWDSPNGWAPLHQIAIESFNNYGYHDLANTIKERWVKTNLLVFDKYHKFIEKYDVINPGELGGGGEYPLQDGFGWTNGVFESITKNKIS